MKLLPGFAFGECAGEYGIYADSGANLPITEEAFKRLLELLRPSSPRTKQ